MIPPLFRLLFLFIAVTGYLTPMMSQPYFTGHRELSVTDPDRANRVVDFHIYYPADNEGDNVPVTSVNNNRFPLVVFGHGFVMVWSAYQNIWSALVPEGYIVVLPTTESGFSPSHDTFGKDLAFLIRAVTDFGNNSSSVFYHRIDSMNCVMGHSMGGGAAVLAAALEPAAKFFVTFAAAETNPSAITAAIQIGVPALIFAGENDCVTPPASHQLPIYNGLNSLCKTYISISGGSHCLMAESNIYCNIGEASCTPQPTITRAQQHSVINRYLVPWLNFHLNGDNNAGVLFDATISSDPEIAFLKTCDLTSIEKRFQDNYDFVRISPNPFSKKISIDLPAGSVGIFTLYDIRGAKVYETMVDNSGSIYPGSLSESIYIWRFISNSGTHSSGKIIRTEIP